MGPQMRSVRLCLLVKVWLLSVKVWVCVCCLGDYLCARVHPLRVCILSRYLVSVCSCLCESLGVVWECVCLCDPAPVGVGRSVCVLMSQCVCDIARCVCLCTSQAWMVTEYIGKSFEGVHS